MEDIRVYLGKFRVLYNDNSKQSKSIEEFFASTRQNVALEAERTRGMLEFRLTRDDSPCKVKLLGFQKNYNYLMAEHS